MRARNAGNFPCASCTVPVHTSCSGSLPGPSQACSSHLYSLVPTPVLLADVISGVRIGEERRNVLTGGRQLLARREYRANRIFVSRVFLYFFSIRSFFLPPLRPLFAVLSSSLFFLVLIFSRILVRPPPRSHTACGYFFVLSVPDSGACPPPLGDRITEERSLLAFPALQDAIPALQAATCLLAGAARHGALT